MLNTTLFCIKEALDDESELLRIEDRLQLIHTLERKYGPTVADVLQFKAKIDQELAALDHDEFDIEQLQVKQNELRQVVRKQAVKLREVRQEVARHLEQAVNQQLSELLMSGAESEVRFEPITGYISSVRYCHQPFF